MNDEYDPVEFFTRIAEWQAKYQCKVIYDAGILKYHSNHLTTPEGSSTCCASCHDGGRRIDPCIINIPEFDLFELSVCCHMVRNLKRVTTVEEVKTAVTSKSDVLARMANRQQNGRNLKTS